MPRLKLIHVNKRGPSSPKLRCFDAREITMKQILWYLGVIYQSYTLWYSGLVVQEILGNTDEYNIFLNLYIEQTMTKYTNKFKHRLATSNNIKMKQFLDDA